MFAQPVIPTIDSIDRKGLNHEFTRINMNKNGRIELLFLINLKNRRLDGVFNVQSKKVTRAVAVCRLCRPEKS